MKEPAILWEQLAIGNQQFSCAFRPMVGSQHSALGIQSKNIAADFH